MTLEQLRIFVAVADRLHMTQAAQALHITQSTASAAIAALEARYNVQLFNRVGRGLELSEPGRIFLLEAKAVLARSDLATQALYDLGGLKRGLVRVAASQTVANYWIPERLMNFAQQYPTLDLSLTVGNTEQVAQYLFDGEVDLGVVEGVVDSPLLTRRIVGSDRLRIYAAPHHPLALMHAPCWPDLEQASWVLRESGSGTRIQLQEELLHHGIVLEDLQVLLELPSNEAVLAAVAQGAAVSAVSELAAAPHVAAGSLTPLPFCFPPRHFVILQHKDRAASRAVQAFSAVC